MHDLAGSVEAGVVDLRVVAGEDAGDVGDVDGDDAAVDIEVVVDTETVLEVVNRVVRRLGNL